MKNKIFRKYLVIGIMILFIGVSVIPSISGANVDSNIVRSGNLLDISNGDTLYVGGSGEGNYTKIQDAIDNASDGDTVFVYDDLSPYYEALYINKTINLIGEDRYTTIIDGNNESSGIFVEKDGSVTIFNFTIQNTITGIDLYCNSGTRDYEIYFITIKNAEIGIQSYCFNEATGYIYIEENTITECDTGLKIILSISGFTLDISSNEIINNEYGIEILGVSSSRIQYNNISNNKRGISTERARNLFISTNNFISNSDYGIYFEDTSIVNEIKENNFINNGNHVFFKNCFINKYVENYWDDWIGLHYWWAKWFSKVIVGRYGPILWLNFDWYPASEPYDI